MTDEEIWFQDFPRTIVRKLKYPMYDRYKWKMRRDRNRWLFSLITMALILLFFAWCAKSTVF